MCEGCSISEKKLWPKVWQFHCEKLHPTWAGKQHDFIRLIDAPLSNFPTAAWEVDDEEIDGKKDVPARSWKTGRKILPQDEKSTGDGDEEGLRAGDVKGPWAGLCSGLLIPYLWQQCLERTDCVA